jgi:hypothetical protein
MTRRAVREGRLVLAGICGLAVAWGWPLGAQSAAVSSARVLDRFDDLAPWQAAASDGARSSVQGADGVQGRALRLDFDLAGTAGYALARRALPLDLPPHYEISFYIRADAPVNNFQLKLVDESGENVWWFTRPNFQFPREWQPVRIKTRQIQFAWGPTKERTLRHAAAVEFVVAAGRGGGRGSVYVSQFVLRELPTEPAAFPPPVVRASSSSAGAEPPLALDGDVGTAWKSDPGAGAAQDLTIDFGRPREFGGLIVRWLEHAHASRYDVQFSDDGVAWRTVRAVVAGNGGPDVLWLPEAETRFVRLALRDGPARAYGVAEVEVEAPAFGESPNAPFQLLARESPPGTYPRGFSGRQTSWTVVGVDGGRESGLLSEDGALEVAKGGFSIEPFVVSDSRVVTWADVHAQHFLVDQYLPIPGVTWQQAEWELRISAFASGSLGESRLVARYDVRNLTGRALPLQLVLGVRPFQVNPPAQSLNTPGGVSSIRDINWDGAALSVNTDRKVFPLRAPDRVGVFPFDAGPLPKRLAAPDWPVTRAVHDDVGYASAALVYPLTVAPRASATVGLVVPLGGAVVPPDLKGLSPAAWMMREQNALASAWREKLNRVSIHVPASGQPLIATLRTALAHLLITRDGPVLRPGTRSYARSWIRDGAMIAESLLRLGHADVAADYLRWYAPHQFADGKVPCCIDERGADPVPENDSPGELIFLASEVYRYTNDRALLEHTWPRVEAAARYLDTLRRSERTDANLTPSTRAFYGLLPASISHEGYSEKPMHSYWDDFWALKGFGGAAAIAAALGHDDSANRLTMERDEFRQDLATSLRRATAAHNIDYLPGSAELGDFDPTSSTIALAPAGEVERVAPDLVRPTFERYWREFLDRREGRKAWEDYTPYEIRAVGTFVRLGWRDRAYELLAFFMAGRRPAEWNQWAEVVGRDPEQPRFVGDMPHGWVASDFIRSTLDLFAYERETDQALVLAAGIAPEWLDGSGVTLKDLRTPYGRLSYSLKREGADVLLQVAAGARVPPGGLVFVWPGRQPPTCRTLVNGKETSWHGAELRLDEVPAKVVVHGCR